MKVFIEGDKLVIVTMTQAHDAYSYQALQEVKKELTLEEALDLLTYLKSEEKTIRWNISKRKTEQLDKLEAQKAKIEAEIETLKHQRLTGTY